MPLSVLQALLDDIRYPVFVVGRAGNIHFRNAAATERWRALDGPGRDQKIYSLLGGRDATLLCRALEKFFVSTDLRSTTFLSSDLCVEMKRVKGDAKAVVTFRALALPQAEVDDVEKLLKLTPAQARLSVAIFNGKTVKDYARETETALATVRWHLSRVLKRTECKNQNDLIRRIATLG